MQQLAELPSKAATDGLDCPCSSVQSVPVSSAAVSASALCTCPAMAVVPGQLPRQSCGGRSSDLGAQPIVNRSVPPASVISNARDPASRHIATPNTTHGERASSTLGSIASVRIAADKSRRLFAVGWSPTTSQDQDRSPSRSRRETTIHPTPPATPARRQAPPPRLQRLHPLPGPQRPLPTARTRHQELLQIPLDKCHPDRPRRR